MPNDSVPSPKIIGLECESLEGASWGTGRIVSRLIRELSRIPGIEHRYRFICYSNNPLPPGIVPEHPAFIARPVGMKTLSRFFPSSFSAYYYVLLPFRLRRDRPAMVYYPNYMLPIIHPSAVRSLVLLTDDIYREAHNPDLALRYRAAYRIFATGWAAHHANAIHAISHASANTLTTKGIERSRIFVNELAVDTVHREEQEATSTFLFVGQAFERRRLRECLLAFERIAQDCPGISFSVVGKDIYRSPTIGALVRSINGRLGRDAVSWREYIPDRELSVAYGSAETILYVSDSEAFGLPPLEGLAHGCVPVVAATPLNREIYGDGAFFVEPPFSTEAIERAMRATMTDHGHVTYVRSVAPTTLERYTWSAHAKRFLGIVERIST